MRILRARAVPSGILLLRELRILAERFCRIGDEVSYTIKKLCPQECTTQLLSIKTHQKEVIMYPYVGITQIRFVG